VSQCPNTEDGVHIPVTIKTGNPIHNVHPTVKPKDLMARLLHGIPKGEGPVLDPFMGSGSTGIACIETGHDFIGIEREENFIEIATARAEHWKQVRDSTPGDKDPIDIKSDKPRVVAENVLDLFGEG
jgi:hypothetical protein